MESPIDQSPAHGLEPSHTYVQNEGYLKTSGAALREKQDMPGSAHDVEEESDNVEDYDDLFAPSEDEISDTDLQAANSSDYTKAYNRQRRINDPSIPETQKPKTNPQLNTKAAIDDHIKSLSKHTAKLRLNMISNWIDWNTELIDWMC